jgi:hypothetical protein
VGGSTSTGSPSSRTRTLSTGAPTSTGSPSIKTRTLAIKASTDTKADGKETDSPIQPELDLTEDLLLKVVQQHGEEKFVQIEVKDPVDESTGRRESVESDDLTETTSDQTGEESDEESESGASSGASKSDSQLYEAAPPVVGKEEPETKDSEYDSLRAKLEQMHLEKKKVAEVVPKVEATTSPPAPSGKTTSATPDPAVNISGSKVFQQSRRLFPAYHYQPTKDEVTQQQVLLKSHSHHEKGFSANVNAIWSFLSSAFKRRAQKKQKRAMKS